MPKSSMMAISNNNPVATLVYMFPTSVVLPVCRSPFAALQLPSWRLASRGLSSFSAEACVSLISGRAPQIILIYERLAAIVRAALATQSPTVRRHRIKDSDQVENLFERLAKERLAGIEARVEMERRVVKARKKARKEARKAERMVRHRLAADIKRAMKKRMSKLLEAALT